MFDLSQWMNSINFNKNNLILDADDRDSKEKEYNPFIVNRLLSLHPDSIMYSSEMNQYSCLDKRLQYEFYLYGLRIRKRWSKWIKPEKSDDLELIKSYFKYSNKKAEEALRILTTEQLEEIRENTSEGGKKK